MDVTVFDVQGVDPHLENSFFLTAFWIIIFFKHFSGSEVFFGWGKSRAVIEDLSAVDKVQFLVSFGDVIRSHERWDTQLLGVGDDFFSSVIIIHFETTLVTLSFIKLVKEVSIGFSIFQIR